MEEHSDSKMEWNRPRGGSPSPLSLSCSPLTRQGFTFHSHVPAAQLPSSNIGTREWAASRV